MLEILFCALLFLLTIAPWNHCLLAQRFFSLFIQVYIVLQHWFNHSCMDGYLISFQYFLNLQECCCANLVYMYFFLRCVSSGYIRRCRTAESKHKYILFHAANFPPKGYTSLHSLQWYESAYFPQLWQYALLSFSNFCQSDRWEMISHCSFNVLLL